QVVRADPAVVLQVRGEHREPAVTADLHVQRAAGRAGGEGEPAEGLGGPAARAQQVAEAGAGRVGELLRPPQDVGDGAGDELRRARLAAGTPGVQRGLVAVFVVVQDDLAEVHR